MPITPVAMQIAAEEGRLKKALNMDTSLDSLDFKSESSSHQTINYPVGKPLEVKRLLSFSCKLYGTYGKTHVFNKQSNQ